MKDLADLCHKIPVFVHSVDKLGNFDSLFSSNLEDSRRILSSLPIQLSDVRFSKPHLTDELTTNTAMEVSSSCCCDPRARSLSREARALSNMSTSLAASAPGLNQVAMATATASSTWPTMSSRTWQRRESSPQIGLRTRADMLGGTWVRGRMRVSNWACNILCILVPPCCRYI